MVMEDVEAGFAKLQGDGFEYYMHSYSIILGRNSKTAEADIDLSDLGGGMNISRHHARIFYDFDRKIFALEVMGRNGCNVRGMHYNPGDLLVKLFSQDLIQIGLPGKRGGRKEDDNWPPSVNKVRFLGDDDQDALRSTQKRSWSVHGSPNPYLLPRQGLP